MDYFISMVSVSGSISLLKLCLNISLHIRWFSQHKIIYHLLDFLQIFVTAGWKSHWKCLLNNLWYSNSIWLLFKFFPIIPIISSEGWRSEIVFPWFSFCVYCFIQFHSIEKVHNQIHVLYLLTVAHFKKLYIVFYLALAMCRHTMLYQFFVLFWITLLCCSLWNYFIFILFY